MKDELSDFELVDGDTGKKYSSHRVVMASASGLIRQLFIPNQSGSE